MYEYVTLHGKGDFSNVIKIIGSQWRDTSDYMGGVESHINIRAFKNREFSLARLRETLQKKRKRNVTDRVIRYIPVERI